MTVQSEQQLENSLIAQLQQLDYKRVKIQDESQLLSNLKIQIERVNGLNPLSPDEWKQVLSHLNTGTIFERAKKLRDKFPVKFDDGSSQHIYFLSDDPRQNLYQVSNQIKADHSKQDGRTSRFDVTLLINGLPLVQIELKKRGMEIAEAFNQTLRYSTQAYKAGNGLFQFIQLFVISNGVNTRYYANGTQHQEFTFPWADIKNKAVNEIVDFAQVFLTHEHLNKMLWQYMVLLHASTPPSLMVLRPYQIYAVEKIVERVNSSQQNGYIWHTTGSGKTLTSFKASQIIMQMPEVKKVLFVVDRNDLDTQTANEFNAFKAESVDSTTNTANLIKQLSQNHDKLIVTTIQKLNKAISNERYAKEIGYLQDEKVVFIFDECHRSQFGQTHQNIKKFFRRAQMFGFTGTPIFKANGVNKSGLKLTTKYLFDECLHQYVIVDAIRDKNVLPFQIDYRGKFTAKGMQSGEDVEGIDTQELYDNPQRLKSIARYIVDTHDIKTKKRQFTAMFCVSSVNVLTQYYDIFEQVQVEKQADDEAAGRIFKPLTIATIFSYAANEQRSFSEDDSLIEEESADLPSQIDPSSRDKLDHYIAQYNQKFKSNFNSGDQFYAYYRDIAKRVKNKQIDILLVVNMFLTGFDSKRLNTLYVDKNLKHHGLIQAFSRTNRVLDSSKPFGNIICFRNLKQSTDAALAMFSDKEQAAATVIVPKFEVIKKDYDQALEKLFQITPEYQAVDDLYSEDEQLAFIKAFREVMRYNAQLETFVEYDQDQTRLIKQEMLNFQSKYVDLCRQVKSTTQKQKVSVLDDVDFQLELLHSDRINVGYILNLLQMVVNSPNNQQRQQYEAQIHDLLVSEISLHDKQELIDKFIQQHIPKLMNGQDVHTAFKDFWDAEKEQAYQQFCEQENLKADEMKIILEKYEYTQRLPRKEEITRLPNFKVGLFKRDHIFSDLLGKTTKLIEQFYKGL